MSNTRRFEGENLDELLEEVRSTLGPGATIREANRLRRGGIAGFFAKERYEVVVDEPSAPGLRATAGEGCEAAGPSAPLDLLALADRVSDSDVAVMCGPAVPTPVAARPLDAPTVVSTEREPFNAVLQRMADDAGIALDLGSVFDLGRDLDLGTASDATEAGRQVPTRPVAGLVPQAAEVAADEQVTATDEDVPSATTSGPVAAGTGTGTGEPALGTAPAAPAPGEVGRAAAEPNALEVPASIGTSVATEADLERLTPDRLELERVAFERAAREWRRLGELGLPADLTPEEGTGDPAIALAHLLEAIPAAPALPALPGAVIAVVGTRAEALALAGELATDLGLDPRSVMLASRSSWDGDLPEANRIPDVAGAKRCRLAQRSHRNVTMVAVDAPPVRAAAEWAADVLDALEPTMTWGTVPASRKPEDLEDWAARLGGLDALALTDLDATVSPASALQTGIPVGRLGGLVATPARWAAVLSDRLELAAA